MKGCPRLLHDLGLLSPLYHTMLHIARTFGKKYLDILNSFDLARFKTWRPRTFFHRKNFNIINSLQHNLTGRIKNDKFHLWNLSHTSKSKGNSLHASCGSRLATYSRNFGLPLLLRWLLFLHRRKGRELLIRFPREIKTEKHAKSEGNSHAR